MKAALEMWQQRLGLMDWDITLQLKDPSIFDDRGHVVWDGDLKKAVVTLRQGDPDIKTTLVHELVHLHFVDCEISMNILEPFLGSIALEIAKKQMAVGIERAVEKITTALICD